MTPKERRQKGFTLIELMIVVAVLSALIAPLAVLEIHSTERFHGGIIRRDLAEAGARSLEWIAHDLRTAVAVRDRLGDQVLAPDRIILQQPDGRTVIYFRDPNLRALLRTEYAPDGQTALATTTLALDLKVFAIEPVDPNAPLYNVRLDFYRTMLNVPLTLTMKGTMGRRRP